MIVEIVVFALIGTNFFTSRNFLQIPRISVELGLLALAMTPVIVTGGIDLSVGSLLGLCAVVFGKLWRDAHLDPWMAAGGAMALGTVAGGLNATLITRLRIPPLIVTLGSYSLFRGLAEGITKGVDNFTNFPAGFVFLGQGYFWNWLPAQLPILVLAAIGFWILLHRSAIGRMLSAIGYSPEGAACGDRRRAAGVLAYILSGLWPGVAAVVYACASRTGEGGCGHGI